MNTLYATDWLGSKAHWPTDPFFRLPQERQQRRRPWRLLLHPLTAICVVQAALSLSLVWSNAAFKTRRTISGSVSWNGPTGCMGHRGRQLC